MIEIVLRWLFISLLVVLSIWLFYITVGLDISSLSVDANGDLDQNSFPVSVQLLDIFSDFSTRNELTNKVSQITFFVSVIVAVLGVIYSLISSDTVAARISRFKQKFPIKVVPISSIGVDDIDLMARYYKNAEYVSVFSGDFSWLNADNSIASVVENLVSNKRIKFFSSKSRSEVAEKIGPEKFRRYLPYFQFGESTGFKASLIQMQGGTQYLLYNKREAEAKNDIIVFENKDTLSEPIQRLVKLVNGVKTPPFIVFVCGETGSGKSAAARMIQSSSNAQLISVGGIFRQLTNIYGKKNSNRNDVIATGVKYLNEFGAKALAEKIIGMIQWDKDIVIIDGLRPPDSISLLKERFPRHVLLYIDAPEAVRKDRIKDINLDDMNKEVDAMVRSAKNDISSVKIDNLSNSMDDFDKKIQEEFFDKYSFLRQF